MEKLRVLDLFSGIGGFSLGLERTGYFKAVAFCEIDEDAKKVLKKHWPSTPIFNDVKKIVGEAIKDNVDVICGGFPCQDISIANIKGKGLDGERSGLWSEYCRLIQEIQPRWAIIENVPNLRNKGLNQVLADLDAIGYDCEWYILPACAVGAPQERERLWAVAYPQGTAIRLRPNTRRGEALEFGEFSEETTYPIGPRLQRHIQYRLGTFLREEPKITKFGDKLIPSRGEFRDWLERAVRKRDGVPRRVDEPRIKQCGNAVVPQIPELFGRAIKAYELGFQT